MPRYWEVRGREREEREEKERDGKVEREGETEGERVGEGRGGKREREGGEVNGKIAVMDLKLCHALLTELHLHVASRDSNHTTPTFKMHDLM